MSSLFEKHTALARIVCCPRCHDPLAYAAAEMLRSVPLNGTAVCPRCGPVGRVASAKLIFNDELSGPRREPASRPFSSGRFRTNELPGSTIEPGVGWTIDGSRVWTGQSGARLRLTVTAISIGLTFLQHPWSGKVRIWLDGEAIDTLDLFMENGSAERWYPIYLGDCLSTVEVECLGEHHPRSKGAQVFVSRYDTFVRTESEATAIAYDSANRGNPYPDRFLDLIGQQADDALILDCGSGDRSYPDPRVIGFEYSHFSAPDVFGDGHSMPFRDDSFDLVLSQAVVEHLSDPFAAVSEIRRVLKPGGVVYVESAFMQPLHAVPYHFFNTTGWGLAHLFREFDILDEGYAGTLGQTLRWIYDLTSLQQKGLGERVDHLLALVNELDAHISHQELKSFASFVILLARKKASTK